MICISGTVFCLSRGKIFHLWVIGSLAFSCFTGSQICHVHCDSEFSSSDLGSGCPSLPADLKNSAEGGSGGLCLSTGPEVWWLPLVPPSTHAQSGCIKRIVFLLISTQAHPETMSSSPAAPSAAELARLPALFQSLVTCPESSQNPLGCEQGYDIIFSYLILRTCRCASSPASNYLNLWSEV